MKLIDLELLNTVTEQAKANSRLRMNYNFHVDSESKSQRLLNAMEPGTEMPIHRHLQTAESIILLRGKLKIVYYNDAAEIIGSVELDPLNAVFGIEIPCGQWHTLEVLESGSVIFEAKDGPYKPIEISDILVTRI